MDEIRKELANLKFKLINEDRNLLHDKILDQAPCIITEMHSGLIVFASKRVNDIFGYIHNELEGKNISHLMPEKYRGRHAAHLANYSKTPTYRNMGEHGMVLRGLKKDKTEFDIKISLEPFYEEGSAFVLATLFPN
jgi:PAS domain S-box-containing protein